MLTESVMLLAVADVLIDAASVLGGDATLRILYNKLVEVRIILFDAGTVLFFWRKIYRKILISSF